MLARQKAHVSAIHDGQRSYLESLIRADYERCHPDETLEDIKRRAVFAKYDNGLLRDWMRIAAKRAAAAKRVGTDYLVAAE